MKLLLVQTVLRVEDLEALKKTEHQTTKDALYEAVMHYLKCSFAGKEEDLVLKKEIKRKIKQARLF